VAAPNPSFVGTFPGDPKNPLRVGHTVVPNSAADLPWLGYLHVGVAGNVKMDVSDGTLAGVVTLTTFLEVGWHPIQPSRIWAAPGTTASDMTIWRQ
jgi:hypothetical protein